MSAAELIALAARCEQATAPDRELDTAIYFAVECDPIPEVGVMVLSTCVKPGAHGYFYTNAGAPTDGSLAPAYTASIDAAMTLVPEGWLRRMHERFPDGLIWWELAQREKGWIKGRRAGGEHPTIPALALTAASLRARAAQ